MAGYQTVRDELSGDVFEVTDEIAGYQWTLDTIRQLHQDLNRGMKAEVDYLTALDKGAVAAAS